MIGNYIFACALSLPVVSIPHYAYADEYRQSISEVERAIISKLDVPTEKDRDGDGIIRKTNISLNDSLFASVSAIDKKGTEKSPDDFHLFIYREKNGKPDVVENFIDKGMDGLDNNDIYRTPKPSISESIGSFRFNRIPQMTGEQIRELNRSYMQRLKQVNKALIR